MNFSRKRDLWHLVTYSLFTNSVMLFSVNCYLHWIRTIYLSYTRVAFFFFWIFHNVFSTKTCEHFNWNPLEDISSKHIWHLWLLLESMVLLVLLLSSVIMLLKCCSCLMFNSIVVFPLFWLLSLFNSLLPFPSFINSLCCFQLFGKRNKEQNQTLPNHDWPFRSAHWKH